MIQTVVFDIGMVLVYFRWRELYQDLGFEGEKFDRIAEATVYNPWWNEFDKGEMTVEEIIDKYALSVGGADTHRFGLDDMVLIKDNHIATCENPLDALLKAKTNTSFSKKIEIEVETLDDAIECVKKGADIVMLDNMSPNEVSEVIDMLNEQNIRQCSLIEVSGGITENTILDYAKLGVDIISIGALTHSSRSLNFSMRF